jgi:hypothetical protein
MSFIDTIIAYKFVQILSTPWKQMDAFKRGVIDEKGNLLISRSKLKTDEQKRSYPSVFYTLCWNIKRILEKVGLGQSIGGFVSALYLLREKIKENDELWSRIQASAVEVAEHSGVSFGLSQLREAQGEDLVPSGTYILRGKKIVVEETLRPHGTALGVSVFEKDGSFFTSCELAEDGAAATGLPANNVGGGAIAGVSPGQEPPMPKKKRRKRLLGYTETLGRDVK